MQKGKVFSTFQNIGRSFMLPVALLPVAGLFLGIGAHLLKATTEGSALYKIITIFTNAGDIVFGNLPLIFAIAVALGMAKAEKEVAALSAAIAFIVMYSSLTTALDLGLFKTVEQLENINGLVGKVLGFDKTLNMGVFGGILIGLVVAYLHNRFYKIEFPDFLSFFGGVRFVPIISTTAAVIIGIIMALIWPYIGQGIASLGIMIAKLGPVGTFLYGYIYRALIPLGLHHVFYMPFWQTALGGTEEVCGVMVEGAQKILFAQMKPCAGNTPFSPSAARFFSGMFPFMIFGFPAAAFAMYQTAKPEKKKEVKGLLFSASLTSILTGITEPIEFSFLFASPLLYFGVHCVLAAFSFVILSILKVGVGLTFSGGLIDLILYGVVLGQARSNWIPVVIVGIIYGFIYYFVFRYFITKFNLKTPGREDDDVDAQLYTKKDYLAKKDGEKLTKNEEISATIIEALGGEDNLIEVGNCATRLRVVVKDGEKVNKGLLKTTGASGVMVSGGNVQVVYGPKVSNIKTYIEEYRNSNK